MSNIQRLTDLSKTELAEILSELTGLPESDYESESKWDLLAELKNLDSEF